MAKDTQMLQNELLHHEKTPYADFSIVKRGLRVDMDVKGAVFATYHPQFLLTGYSWDALTAAAILSPYKKVRRALMLGVAAGTALRQMRHLWPQTELVGIEIDKKLTRAAERFMGLKHCGAHLVFGDADQKINKLTGNFDVIIDDLYKSGAEDVERGGVAFEKRLTRLKGLLAPKGILVANFIDDHGFEAELDAGTSAFCSNFNTVASLKSPYGLNKILVGGKNVLPPKTLTDYLSCWESPHEQKCWKGLRVTPVQNYP